MSAVFRTEIVQIEDADGWHLPLPLPSGLPAVESFDLSMLPDPFVPWVSDIARRMQAPAEYVAVPAMVAAGAIIGRKVGIRPQEHTDWYEVPNLWGCVVGRPGVMKSPAVQAALAPINRLQAEARRDFEGRNAQYQSGALERELRAEASKKKIKDIFKNDLHADLAGLLPDEEPSPTLKRYLANDTSYQSLGELLIENTNGILVYRDELLSLITSLDREENVEARGFYLTGWNGTDDYTFDRITRGKNLYVPSLTISLIGSTQPGRLREYAMAAIRGGAGDDGLIQRFSLMVWPDVSSKWIEHDVEPDPVARREASEVFKRLDNITPPSIGARVEPNDESRPYLRFDGEALTEFQTWRLEHERRLRTGELHAAMESHLAKYRKLIPCISLIHHLASGKSGPIGVLSVLAALSWGEYLESHAQRIYSAAIDSSADAARELVRHVARGDIPPRFSAREVLRKGWSSLTNKNSVIEALDLLEEQGWVRRLEIPSGARGGRPTVHYIFNPRGLDQ